MSLSYINPLWHASQCAVLEGIRDESEELMSIFLPIPIETFLDY